MELRKKSDDAKIIIALICLLIGFLFIWSITAQMTDIYELRLDAETCYRVKERGLVPSSAECVFTAPFRQAGPGIPIGFVVLPDGNEIQVTPLAASQTGRSMEWSASMKTQLIMALLFWAATLALLFSALRDKGKE